jgi:outer membrane immunogenic protein
MTRYLPSLALGAAAALVSTFAFAADMPRKAYNPVYSPTLATTWSGFYVGANAGYGWAQVGDSSNTMNGFIGGVQAGYNWQIGSFVLGVEGDFQGSLQKRSDTDTSTGIAITIDQKIPWFGTARGRVGYAFDNFLVYATGGAAWLNYKISGTALGVTVSDSTSKTAWTAGAGVEWMFMQSWSAKLEYLYIDTGNTTFTLFGVPISGRAKENIARLGINYHF